MYHIGYSIVLCTFRCCKGNNSERCTDVIATRLTQPSGQALQNGDGYRLSTFTNPPSVSHQPTAHPLPLSITMDSNAANQVYTPVPDHHVQHENCQFCRRPFSTQHHHEKIHRPHPQSPWQVCECQGQPEPRLSEFIRGQNPYQQNNGKQQKIHS